MAATKYTILDNQARSCRTGTLLALLALTLFLAANGLLFLLAFQGNTRRMAALYAPVTHPILHSMQHFAQILSIALLPEKYQFEHTHPIQEQQHEMLPAHFLKRPCHAPSYQTNAIKPIPTCAPPPRCGRMIVENFAHEHEIQQLRSLVDRCLAVTGGGNGGPSVVDFLSGAISAGDKFVDVYRATTAHAKALQQQQQQQRQQQQKQKTQPVATQVSKSNEEATLPPNDPMQDRAIFADDLRTYRALVQRVGQEVKRHFRIPEKTPLFLAKPSFFSKMKGNATARNVHDEYWHDHIDQEQYGSFVYTTLVYLNAHKREFIGGRFRFSDSMKIDTHENKNQGKRLVKHEFVPPKPGRLLMFSSGAENVHGVEKVQEGTRYAITIAFSCDGSLPSSVPVNEMLQDRIDALDAEEHVIRRNNPKTAASAASDNAS